MPELSLPPLAAIRCFEAAARHGSFTRAAEELGMTQAAVSYQIKVLEDRLGGPLFLRGARGVSLTEAGRRIAPAVADAFSRLHTAFDEFNERSEGVLSISVVDGFATNWLAARLGEFQLVHSRIAVKLEISAELVDFKSGDVDVGIRTGRGDWPGLVMHRLFPVSYTPMISPRLLEAVGPLHTPADLLRLPLLDPLDTWWVDWFVGAGVEPPDLSRRTEMRVYYQNLAAAAAVAGHGVAMLTPAFFADEVTAGRLVQPFPLVRYPGSDYWLVYPEARRRSAKIRAFRDWLLAVIEPDAGASA